MYSSFEKFPRKNTSSVIDNMTLDKEQLELLPSNEKILEELEDAIKQGKTGASEILREANVFEQIKNVKNKILLLDKSAVLGFFYANQSAFSEAEVSFSEIEKIIKSYENDLGQYNPLEDKIRIFISSIDVNQRNNFAQVQFLVSELHEILHNLSKRLITDEYVQSGLSFYSPKEKICKLRWLNEAVTEKMTQDLISDIISNSTSWEEKFSQLTEDEDAEIRLDTYSEERDSLVDLIEQMLDNCSRYKNIPGTSYKERRQKMELIFKENFGLAYINGDISLLESNIKELGYDSIFDLEQLNPEA